MDADHRSLLAALDAAAGAGVPERRRIAKTWLAAHRDQPDRILAVVESLFAGASHEEKTLAALLLQGDAGIRREVHPDDVDRWLSHLAGWSEVDSLCQSVFTATELLADWPAWRSLIRRLSTNANSNERRASLVLLTGPVHRCDDVRLRNVAF